jgi:hypothetical protein
METGIPSETCLPYRKLSHPRRQYLTIHHYDILQYERIFKKVIIAFVKVLSQSSEPFSFILPYCLLGIIIIILKHEFVFRSFGAYNYTDWSE